MRADVLDGSKPQFIINSNIQKFDDHQLILLLEVFFCRGLGKIFNVILDPNLIN